MSSQTMLSISGHQHAERAEVNLSARAAFMCAEQSTSRSLSPPAGSKYSPPP